MGAAFVATRLMLCKEMAPFCEITRVIAKHLVYLTT